MKLPQLLHSTRSYGRANSAFSWKLLVRERGLLSCRLKLPRDRSEKDAWFGYSPVGALRKSPFISYSRPAEDWLQRSGSSSTISPTTLLLAISARGRRNCSRRSTRRSWREYATTPASMPPPLRHLSRNGSSCRIWDSADLLADQRPLSALLCRPRCEAEATGFISSRPRPGSLPVIFREQVAFDQLDQDVDDLDVKFLDPVGEAPDRRADFDVSQFR